MSDPVFKTTVIAVSGGVLGWALGSLLDVYLPKFQITKNKKVLAGAMFGALALILYLQLGRLPF